MKAEFIPYEEALTLKELGFDEPCFGSWYQGDVEPYLSIDRDEYNDLDIEHLCLSPLYQQAFRWFREEFNNFSNFERTNQGNFNYVINRKSDNICYKSYEESELECLRKLIKIINQNKDE